MEGGKPKKRKKSVFQMFMEFDPSKFKEAAEVMDRATAPIDDQVGNIPQNLAQSHQHSNALQKDKHQNPGLIEEADQQASEQASDLIDQPSKQPVNLYDQPNEQPSNQQHMPAIPQASNQTSEHLSEQAPEQHSKQTSEQAHSINNAKRPPDLNQNQYRILHYIYFNRPFKVKGDIGLQGILNIKYGTVRNSLESLRRKGYIEKPFSINDGINNGSNCRVNELKCLKLFGPTPIRQPSKHTTEQASQQVILPTTEQVPTQPDNRTNTQTITPYISSSSINKNYYCEIQNILSKHPELGYWRQKGLTTKQIEQWMNVAQCSFENMIQYLCYCRFEMVDLGMEESKPVEKVFNWFFRIIEKTGAYPKPNGYKSHQEKQLEAEREAVEQREKAAQEAEDLYRRKIEAHRKKEFWDMMNDQEGDLFKQCFESLNKIQKRRTSGKGFEMSMRGAFDKLMDGEDEIQ